MAVESTRSGPWSFATRVWGWVVDACPHVTDPEARLHIRIVSALMVTVLPLVVFVEMLPHLGQALDPQQNMDFTIPAATAGLWALVYVLSRRGYYRQATWIAVLTASAAVFLAVLLPYYLEPAYDFQERFKDLDYLVLALLLASTLLSLPAVRFLATLNILIIFALLLFIPVADPSDVLRPLSFVAVAGVLLMLLTRHRNSLERYHTSQLVEANQRLKREVEERQAARQALLIEQSRYRGLFENTSDAVFLAGLDGRIETVNQQALALMQATPEDLIGRHYRAIFPPERWIILEAQERMLLEQADLPVFEETLLRLDGAQCPVEMHVSLVRDSARLPSHFQVIARDLTIRQQIESQRRALDTEHQRTDLLRDFVSKMSHDLRTPLTTIKTGLYLARRTADAPDQSRTHLDHIETQVDHLAHILENMLLMTRLDDPDVDLATLTNVSVSALFSSVLSAYMSHIEALDLAVTIDVSPDLEVYADVDLLKEAIRQLVANAFAVVGPGGRIVLRGYTQAQEIILEVADSGPGIPPEELAHIFERFYRGDESRRTATGGTGLGLPIVHRIAELHGGRASVANSPAAGTAADPDSGVTVRLALPARKF
jgi:PAS domain S-box-containing protein